MIRKMLFGLLCVASSTVPAFADGPSYASRGYSPEYVNWSGLYVGAQLGWIWSDIDTTYTAGGGVFHNSWNHDAPMVGGQIGLQHQFGRAVLGIEGNISTAFDNRDAVEVCPNPVVDCHARFSDLYSVGARLGYAMGKWMPYIGGGYANAKFERSTVNPATGVVNDHDEARHDGWYLGAGLDMALSRNWILGIEYRHYEFDDAFHLARNAAGAPVAGSHNIMDASSDSVAVRLNYKFGRSEEGAPLK